MAISQWESVKVTSYEESVGNTLCHRGPLQCTALHILSPAAMLWECSSMNTPFIPGHTSAQWLPLLPLSGKNQAALRKI